MKKNDRQTIIDRTKNNLFLIKNLIKTVTVSVDTKRLKDQFKCRELPEKPRLFWHQTES